MIRNIIFFVLFVLIVFPSYSETRVDTLYYDKDWKVVNSKVFASYYRIFEVPDETEWKFNRKQFRDFYITGELQAEGTFTSLDTISDLKSVFDGEVIHYFKDGKVASKGFFQSGKKEGEWTFYKEDGLISSHMFFEKDKLNGVYTQFREDGVCVQTQMHEGKPLYDYYMISNSDGMVCKMSNSTDEPIYESPSLDERKSDYKDGDEWCFYNKNGIFVSVNNQQVRDYGKYYQIKVVISNNSFFPIEIDSSNITASIIDKDDELKDIKVYTVEEYMKKVRRKQNWTMALLGVSAGMNSASAGYSTSNSYTYYNGYSSNTGAYSGFASTTTTTYDAAAAYQAQVLSSQQMMSCSDAMANDREVRQEGYLKRTTIYPGECISGFVNAERKKGSSLMINVNINGAIYKFPYSL